MKKIIIPICLMLVIIVGSSYFVTKKVDTKLGVSSVSAVTDTTSYQLPIAGTTKVFIVATKGADSVDLNVKLTASSTSSVLNWKYEFTNEENCDFNGNQSNCTWYGEDNTTVSSNILTAHSSTTPNHTWTPNTVSTQYKNINVSNASWKFMRTTFYASGATSTIVVEQAPNINY